MGIWGLAELIVDGAGNRFIDEEMPAIMCVLFTNKTGQVFHVGYISMFFIHAYTMWRVQITE